MNSYKTVDILTNTAQVLQTIETIWDENISS
jgi:hypothetical protein